MPLPDKKARLEQAERLQEQIQTGINARLLGEKVPILVEGKQRGKWYGRTRTDKLVFFNGSGDYLGRMVSIRIEKTSPWALQGKIESPRTNREEK